MVLIGVATDAAPFCSFISTKEVFLMSFSLLGLLIAKAVRWWRMRSAKRACHAFRFEGHPNPEEVMRSLCGGGTVSLQTRPPHADGKDAPAHLHRSFVLRYDPELDMLVRDGDRLALFSAAVTLSLTEHVPHQKVADIVFVLARLMSGTPRRVTLIFIDPDDHSRDKMDFVDVAFAALSFDVPEEACVPDPGMRTDSLVAA